MTKKIVIILGVLVVLLGVTGFLVFKSLTKPLPKPAETQQSIDSTIPQVDKSISVAVTKSATKDNTIEINVTGLAGKMSTIGYELSYESGGMIKGVNSGSSAIDVTGKDDFSREVYLGTCSRNVCTPDLGVTKVNLVLEFTDPSGKQSQSTKDYPL
jgi:hypothetical protein